MSKLDLKVRRATSDDASEIARVHVETWRNAYAGMVSESYLVGMTVAGQAFQWRRTVHRRDQVVLVAEASGANPRIPAARGIVGFGSGGPSRHPNLGPGAEVYTLYVLPDWQGQGIGKRLLAGLFDWLVMRGHESALVWVLGANPSRFFYESLGAVRIAERQEAFAGEQLSEFGYAWQDLPAWLARERG